MGPHLGPRMTGEGTPTETVGRSETEGPSAPETASIDTHGIDPSGHPGTEPAGDPAWNAV